MAAGIQGADLAQLQHLVQQLGGPFQSELQSTLNGMNQKVQASSSYWVARHSQVCDSTRATSLRSVTRCHSIAPKPALRLATCGPWNSSAGLSDRRSGPT